MADEKSTSVTTECPNGHRVRGNAELLGQTVRCPRCHDEFVFAPPSSHPVSVIANEADSTESLANAASGPSENPVVSDTGVMRILGDWVPPEQTKSCPRCGFSCTETAKLCQNCDFDLSAAEPDDVSDDQAIQFQPLPAGPSGPVRKVKKIQDTGRADVFEFEDVIVRRVMQPRREIVFIDINQPLARLQEQVRETMHTRYPVCDHSLDQVLGIVHIKDILVVPADAQDFDIRTILRPVRQVPDTMPISKVFRHLQLTHQPIAFVIDEFETIIGMVTLKNILTTILSAMPG